MTLRKMTLTTTSIRIKTSGFKIKTDFVFRVCHNIFIYAMFPLTIRKAKKRALIE